VCVCGRLEEATKATEDIREKIDQQNTQLCDFEAEINMLRRRIEGLTADREKDKRQIAQLQDALNRARIVSSDVLLSVFSLFDHRCDTVEMYRFDFEAELDRDLPEIRRTLLKLNTVKLGLTNIDQL